MNALTAAWLVVQQAGPDLDDYTEGGIRSFFDATISDLTGALGGWGMFGLLIGGAVLYVSWEASPTRSMALPSALTVLLGGALIPNLPGNYRGLAWAIIVVGLAAGFVAVGKKYVMSGGPIR